MREGGNYMDCAEFREMYHELDRPGTLGSAFRDRALLHAETCSRCAALLTEAEALDFALHKLAEQSADGQASPRIEAELLLEFQRRKIASAPRRVRWQLAALGVAAAVLLAAGIVLHYKVTPKPDGKPVTAHTVNPALPVVQGTSNTTSYTVQLADDEYAADFVPLPYADDPSALEGGVIVRVTLPRSSLESFGMEIPPDEEAEDASDDIMADLVLSEDGRPQAIRLVSEQNLYF
jgi:hypothetical protein